MNGRIFLALGGVLLVVGATVGQTAGGPVEEISRLDKARQEAIINELIRAQEQIQRALKRILKDSAPVSEHEQPGGASSEEHYGSDESDEENKWQAMKRQKIAEARARVERNIKSMASNFLDMAEYIEKIDKKVDEELEDQRENVNYNLYYKKPKPHHHHHHSSEESEEHFHYRKRPSRRGGRQLADEQEVEVPVVEQQDVVKTVDGVEVVQTLPVQGTE